MRKIQKIVVSLFNYAPQVMNGTTLKLKITPFHNTKAFHFLFQRTFLLEFSRSFFSQKKVTVRVRGESFSFFIIRVVSGQFLAVPTPRNYSPSYLLFSWIELGQLDLSTHPTPIQIIRKGLISTLNLNMILMGLFFLQGIQFQWKDLR